MCVMLLRVCGSVGFLCVVANSSFSTVEYIHLRSNPRIVVHVIHDTVSKLETSGADLNGYLPTICFKGTFYAPPTTHLHTFFNTPTEFFTSEQAVVACSGQSEQIGLFRRHSSVDGDRLVLSYCSFMNILIFCYLLNCI